MGRPSELADDHRADHGIGSSLAHIGSRLLNSHPDRFPTVFDVVLKWLTVRGSMVGAAPRIKSSFRAVMAQIQFVDLWMALSALKSLMFRAEAPAVRTRRMPKISNPTNPMRPAGGGAFILPSVVGA